MDMHVSIQVTAGFLCYSYVMLQSLFESDPKVKFHVHIFSGDAKESDLEDIRHMASSYGASVHLYHVPVERIREVFHDSTSRHPVEMHTSYFMFDLLPPDVDRIMVLESDMIVKGSFRPLYEMDFGDAYAVSINGDCIWTLPGGGGASYMDTFQKLGVPFYSQVNVLLNVTAIRRDFAFSDICGADARVVELFGRSNEEWAFALLFQGRVRYVSEQRYAFYCSTVNAGVFTASNTLDTLERAVAVHYFGYKPWNSHYDIQHSYWWRVAKRTPYAKRFFEEAEAAVIAMWQLEGVRQATEEIFLDEVVDRVGFLREKRICLTGHMPKIEPLVRNLKDWNFVGMFRKGNAESVKGLFGLPFLDSEEVAEKADAVLVVARKSYFEEQKQIILETRAIQTLPVYFWDGRKIC
ncbi:hypothetical protein TAMA11512_22040 [Selenomonas sp. TAMA-11512]|uniref:glycosyltransferase family 8 protein n=1 Tax=Selenomonas sp. TAMA-11512 TaxID=3095337 RepID=UPI0030886F34|nr:hypothetical protein TAMA11512_22040 [Selenomonas sp. TAMA-11512]